MQNFSNTSVIMKRRRSPETGSFKHESARVGLPTNVHLYDGNFPFFRKPVEIGSFSHNSERKFVHDKSQLKYYAPPEDLRSVHFDLTNGFETFTDKSTVLHAPEMLDDLLRWVLQNTHKFSIDPRTPHRHGQVEENLVKK